MGNQNGFCGIGERKIVEARDVEIEIAVVIESMKVGPSASAPSVASVSIPASLVTSLNVPLPSLWKRMTLPFGADGEVGLAVVIVIAHGAAHPWPLDFQMGFAGDIQEFAGAEFL